MRALYWLQRVIRCCKQHRYLSMPCIAAFRPWWYLTKTRRSKSRCRISALAWRRCPWCNSSGGQRNENRCARHRRLSFTGTRTAWLIALRLLHIASHAEPLACMKVHDSRAMLRHKIW